MLNRFREMMKPRSIRYKLTVASIACILVPAVCTLFIYNMLTQEAVKKQAISNAQESLLLVNGIVSNQLKSMLNIANYVQINSEMNAYFKMLASGNAYDGIEDSYRKFKDANHVIEQLDSLTVVGDQYVTVLLTDDSFFTTYSLSDYNPLQLKNEPWFEGLKNLKGFKSYWTGVTPTVFSSMALDNPYQLSVVRTLRLGNSELYGYVVVTVMENQIKRIFNQLTDNGEVMIVDGHDRILSHRNDEEIGTLSIFSQQIKGSNTSTVVTLNGKDYLITKQDLASTDWHLVSVQPYKHAIANISTIFNKVFLLQIGSFIVFLLLLLVLLRAFTKPLVRLGKVATTVQRGNLLVRTGVRGQDEIGRLGYLFDQMLDKVKDMISEISETQGRKRKAELKMLQAQINPHFLFNVLNSIRMNVMRRGDPESAKMIGSLSRLLRMSISHEQDEITLHEEMDLLTHYVDLMNMRQKEKVMLFLNVPSEAFLMMVPRFFLQPIVENALIHGLNRCAGVIDIQAEIGDRCLILTVEDDGNGMDVAKLAALRSKLAGEDIAHADGESMVSGFSSIGLLNVHERMKMTFGEKFVMDVQSEPGKGTQIKMFIPLKGGTQNV